MSPLSHPHIAFVGTRPHPHDTVVGTHLSLQIAFVDIRPHPHDSSKCIDRHRFFQPDMPCAAWDGHGVGGSVVWAERRVGSCVTSGLGGTVMCVAWAGRGAGSRVTPGPAKRDGEHQRTIDPRRHMVAAPCVGFRGSIKAPLGIIRCLRPPNSQIWFKNSLSAVKKQVKYL
ncbi:hypothetical protein B0H11DRAFT_2214837 [Mycena galericulata]|nr:hypothetical protein B0H11DRAFT_2214837 [Mycena galericulata]